MTTLHERMTHLVKQLNIPLVEVSLVISKYVNHLLAALQSRAEQEGETLPVALSQPWPLDEVEHSKNEPGQFDIERLLDSVDSERMDILDTLIRTTLNGEEVPHSDALHVIRWWQKEVRQRMAEVSSPGQLFSPLEVPEDL